ncbi:MAG: M14 family metallopeptidase [Lachnospiraceae bacterium]|nr:M14 family metallopeptidase [Lachnospiraceae bacterium]MDD3616410.1 M14 family metallopeptidase [Lachnospiraceae bacterium]
MIETVTSVKLPVDESLLIQKNRMEPLELTGREKRMTIVTGTHGDELEGQFVCYEVLRRIRENMDCLKGIVDVFPALNPLGIDSITRGIPQFDLDMNRIFPGSQEGVFTEYVAAEVVNDIAGSDLCVDVHASNIYLREMPQIRISENTATKLIPYAKLMNVDFVWVHAAATVLESTLAHSLNMMGVPTLVVEMGVGMRITKEYCYQLVDGIFNVMSELGIWTGEVNPVREPYVSVDEEVGFVNADASGIFVPAVPIWSYVEEGGHIGDILNPLTGLIEHRMEAPCTGTVFTLREYPIVYHGSLIARVLGGVKIC